MRRAARSGGLRTFPALILAVAVGLAALVYAGAAAASRDEPLYRGLDGADIGLARAAVQRALETLQSARSLGWTSASGRVSGSVTPLATFKTTTGYYCRRYREAVVSAAQGVASAVRIACRDDDGRWKPVDW